MAGPGQCVRCNRNLSFTVSRDCYCCGRFVAIRQSGDAKEIAEDGHNKAVERELLFRQIDSYEKFAALTIEMAQSLQEPEKEYVRISTNFTLQGGNFTVLLGSTKKKLADSIIAYSEVRQGTGLVLNRWTETEAPEQTQHQEIFNDYFAWKSERSTHQSDYLAFTSVLVAELAKYYIGERSSDEVSQNLDESTEIARTIFGPAWRLFKAESLFSRGE